MHVQCQPARGVPQQWQADDGRGPAQQLVEDGVRGTLGGIVEWAGHAQHRCLEPLAEALPHTGYGPDLLESPFAIESEGAGAAEELGRIGDDQNGFHAHPEASDLAAALARHAHAQNGLRALGSYRGALIGAVEMRIGENDLDGTARLVGDFVGCILNELE